MGDRILGNTKLPLDPNSSANNFAASLALVNLYLRGDRNEAEQYMNGLLQQNQPLPQRPPVPNQRPLPQPVPQRGQGPPRPPVRPARNV